MLVGVIVGVGSSVGMLVANAERDVAVPEALALCVAAEICGVVAFVAQADSASINTSMERETRCEPE